MPHGAQDPRTRKADGQDQNRVQADDIFSNEASVIFQFDWIETGPAKALEHGPPSWRPGLKPYDTHVRGLRGTAARFRQGNALSLPYRDGKRRCRDY